MALVHLDRASFDRIMADNSGKTVLIDFWATWCGPCQMLGPELEKLAAERPELIIGKVDVTNHPDIAAEFGINTIPALFLVKNGKVTDKAIGYMDKNALISRFGL